MPQGHKGVCWCCIDMSLRKSSERDRGCDSRQQKTRSLIVPTTIISDPLESESPSSEPKHRFSFGSFRRGRSLSKSRCSSPQPEQYQHYSECDRCGVDISNKGNRTPSKTPDQSPPIRKSLSVVDFRSFCTKLHRHLTTGIFLIEYNCWFK